jgi:hypothetical protein
MPRSSLRSAAFVETLERQLVCLDGLEDVISPDRVQSNQRAIIKNACRKRFALEENLGRPRKQLEGGAAPIAEKDFVFTRSLAERR